MEDYLPKVILTEPYRSLELVTNGDSPFDRKVSWMFWSGGAGREGAQPTAMGHGRAGAGSETKILMPMLPSGKAFVAQAKKRWQLKSQLAKGYYGLEGWQKI